LAVDYDIAADRGIRGIRRYRALPERAALVSAAAGFGHVEVTVWSEGDAAWIVEAADYRGDQRVGSDRRGNSDSDERAHEQQTRMLHVEPSLPATSSVHG